MEVGGRQEVHELDLVVVDNLDVLFLDHGLEQPVIEMDRNLSNLS